MSYDLVTGGYDLSILGADDDANFEALLAAASGEDQMSNFNWGIAGADSASLALSEQAKQAVLARKVAQGSLALQQNKPTRAREYPLGFVSAAPVAAGAQAQVVSQPQVVFRPARLVIPSDIAGQFVIDQLLVGKNSQFASAAPNPARVFAENAVGVGLGMDTAQISQNVTIVVTNIGGAAATFRASVIGPAVE